MNKLSADLLYADKDFFVDSTCTDMSKIKLNSDANIRDIYKKLEARHAVESKTAFDQTQKLYGFTYYFGSILREERLLDIFKPVSCTTFDWMHCILQSGVFSITVGDVMQALKPFGIDYKRVGEYVERWNWPRRIGYASGKDQFTKNKAENGMKCNCSNL